MPDARKYEPPKLINYGDVNDLTRAVGNSGAKDGGSGAEQKTLA